MFVIRENNSIVIPRIILNLQSQKSRDRFIINAFCFRMCTVSVEQVLNAYTILNNVERSSHSSLLPNCKAKFLLIKGKK